jgi:hypothetical protein
MKIKIDLNGGLGNQMFQYAFGKSLAIHYNSELYFETANISLNPERKLMLDKVFGLNLQFDQNKDYQIILENEPHYPNKEKKYHSLDTDKNYHFIGYWQNESYFKKYESAIRDNFKLENRVLNSKSIILQIRRGDFVGNINHEYCDLQWYARSLNLMKTKVEFQKVLVSTDDIDWVKKNLILKNVSVVFLKSDEKETFEEMTGCENFIISNSSFGWWGAWLANAKNVICPKVWYPADLRWNTALDSWIKI